MRTVTLTQPYRNEGTIMLFGTDDGLVIAVDHRPAQVLLEALEDGEVVEVEVEEWQIVGRS